MHAPDTLFPQLWSDALAAPDRDAWVSDWALSSMWGDDPESEIPAERIDLLGRIYDAAHMSVGDICRASGLTQAALAARFCIPKRTVESWCGISPSARSCPAYIRLMMCECLGLIDR